MDFANILKMWASGRSTKLPEPFSSTAVQFLDDNVDYELNPRENRNVLQLQKRSYSIYLHLFCKLSERTIFSSIRKLKSWICAGVLGIIRAVQKFIAHDYSLFYGLLSYTRFFYDYSMGRSNYVLMKAQRERGSFPGYLSLEQKGLHSTRHWKAHLLRSHATAMMMAKRRSRRKIARAMTTAKYVSSVTVWLLTTMNVVCGMVDGAGVVVKMVGTVGAGGCCKQQGIALRKSTNGIF